MVPGAAPLGSQRFPGPGECKRRHLGGALGWALPGKRLHRHISRGCSIGWCWDAPASSAGPCSAPFSHGVFSSQPGSQEWPQCPTGCHQTWLRELRRPSGSHMEKTSCPVSGWVTPAGSGKLWALQATKCLFRARLDLASLSRGVEARAGALKGMLAGLQVSELGGVPLKSPWKILLLWDRKQRLSARRKQVCERAVGTQPGPGSRADTIPITGRTREEDYPENTGAWCCQHGTSWEVNICQQLDVIPTP